MSGVDGISSHAMSETIGAIYDCALDPQLWPDTCRKIAGLFEDTASGICVHDLRNTRNDQLFVVGYQQTFLDRLGLSYADSPMARSDVVSDIGDVKALSIENTDLYETQFFREVLGPFGLRDIMWFPALRTGRRMASMHVSRDAAGATRYREHEISLFRLLAPHICRVLAISDALDIKALRAEILERTLNGLVSGVFLTTGGGRVVYMNEAAERQVRSGKSIRIVNGRLSPIDQATRAVLSRAIDEAARGDPEELPGGHSLAIPDAGGGPGYIATLLPVSQGQRRDLIARVGASVAVFTKDPFDVPMLPGEAFARLYGLTGGELRVLHALAQGLGGKEAAGLLAISEPTIRTHLQRMYSKTNTLRQTDLLRLFQNATPPVGQAQHHA